MSLVNMLNRLIYHTQNEHSNKRKWHGHMADEYQAQLPNEHHGLMTRNAAVAAAAAAATTKSRDVLCRGIDQPIKILKGRFGFHAQVSLRRTWTKKVVVTYDGGIMHQKRYLSSPSPACFAKWTQDAVDFEIHYKPVSWYGER